MTDGLARRAGAKRGLAAALAAACLLAGCARTTPGQVAMTTEPLSPEMTCGEFVVLSDRDRIEIVGQILEKQSRKANKTQTILLSALASLMCKATPEVPLSDVLNRMKVN